MKAFRNETPPSQKVQLETRTYFFSPPPKKKSDFLFWIYGNGKELNGRYQG